ncbi:MAG: ATP-binding protein, partial [Duncaniella sp.]|nr:ATP-binding protein [Duncaniella sp.]
LKLASPQQRIEFQDRLNRIITHSRDYLTALRYIIDGKDQMFIDETLERLKLSGYLYRPEERMRVMMALFTLRKKTVSRYIDDIFDIIRDSHANERFMQLFANAFIEMLDMYIANESRFVNVLTSTEDISHRMMIQQMIKALALRLLLHKPGQTPDSTIAIYRSMLYRYTTLVQSVSSDKMMGKALSSLFGDVANLEFTWSDLNDLNFLCSKIAVGRPGTLAEQTWVYETPQVAMALEGDQFSFTPIVTGSAMYNAIAPDLFSPHRFNILLNERMTQRINASRNNIRQFHALWSEIETSLFAKTQKLNPMRLGHTPEVGDDVIIRVEGKVPGRTYDYQVVIEDPTYVGKGIITPHQIISYSIAPSADVFKDSETGIPMLFRAEVEQRLDDGTFLFTMRNKISDALRDMVDLGGEPWLAQVSGFIGDRILFITDCGFVVYAKRNEVDVDLKENDFVLVTPQLIHENGHIYSTFYGMANEGEVFTRSDAFHNLLEAYADGAISTVIADTAEQAECVDLSEARSASRFIDPEMMRELIHIIDRQAMLCDDHILTYCYLAIARIMSRLVNDPQMTGYLHHRMDLVEAIQLFGDDGIIDDISLERLLEDNKDFISSYPDIQNRLTRLRLINRLDKPQPTEWMWEMATASTTDPVTSQLAKLVLSYNLLNNANLYEVRRQIQRKILQLLDLKIKLPESMQVAEEDQFTELKTSIIYPAGNHMLANQQAQMTEILRKIAGMLNAKGGRMYIGVNDSGYAVGLRNDFVYLNKNHQNYDLTTIKDVFDRTVRTDVRLRLGRTANSLINTTFETVANEIIYRIDIDPSPEVVLLDGIAFERQGTSCWPVPATELEKFRLQRKNINS